MVLVAKVCIRKNSCVHKISQNEPFALCLLSKKHYKMKSFVGFILSLYFSLGKFSSIEIHILKFEDWKTVSGSAIKCYYHPDASLYTTLTTTQDCATDMCQAVYESSK